MQNTLSKTQGFAAFKDWAISCAALGEGKQVMLFRKAGISEANDEFKVEHPRFFLFPSWLHQTAEGVKAEYAPDLERVLGEKPAEGFNTIKYFAEVDEAVVMQDMDQIQRQDANHIWSEHTVNKRWEWQSERKFWLLLLRVYKLKEEIQLPMIESYGGCTSWINFEGISEGLECEPVLNDQEYAKRAQQVRDAI